MAASAVMTASGGRDASRERRNMLSRGKQALPSSGERRRDAQGSDNAASPMAMSAPVASMNSVPAAAPAANAAPAPRQSFGGSIGGRDASRARRSALVQGKDAVRAQSPAAVVAAVAPVAVAAVPAATQAVRPIGTHAMSGREESRLRRAALVVGKSALPSRSAQADLPQAGPRMVVSNPEPVVMRGGAASGREMSRARRMALAEGKAALRRMASATNAPMMPASNGAAPAAPAAMAPATPTPTIPDSVRNAPNARAAAQAMRASRALFGRGGEEVTRPCGRTRPDAAPLKYVPKVIDSQTYGQGRVTGVRIGRGFNMTGDERGRTVQVTGSQYVGRESGVQPRPGGIKVGACNTPAGLVVTGTQVRSGVQITGDEFSNNSRITGEADQAPGDDLIDRSEASAYTGMQFQRQHNPHGQTVFGTNLGRSAGAVGSRQRDRDRSLEFTEGGQSISGSAVGRSPNVTGDEPGSCRPITGDQYLMPAMRQKHCGPQGTPVAERRPGERTDPVTGRKVTLSETWSGQRISGLDVEHSGVVTGDEYGVTSTVTGTPYVGPAQYVAHAGGVPEAIVGARNAGSCVTGDTPLHADHVTGTQRGCDRSITGTPYYRAGSTEMSNPGNLENIHHNFSVRTPQRESQLQADTSAVGAPTAAGRITGSFTHGQGKITGNQEFQFTPRVSREEKFARQRISGEGKVDGPAITGAAWGEHRHVRGTEDYIAVERNPSERAGQPHAFANSSMFKGKGNYEPPTHHVTGMVGWSAKSAARVTVSGGALG